MLRLVVMAFGLWMLAVKDGNDEMEKNVLPENDLHHIEINQIGSTSMLVYCYLMGLPW